MSTRNRIQYSFFSTHNPLVKFSEFPAAMLTASEVVDHWEHTRIFPSFFGNNTGFLWRKWPMWSDWDLVMPCCIWRKKFSEKCAQLFAEFLEAIVQLWNGNCFRGRPFDSEGGGWQFRSGQNIYFPATTGQNSYFQHDQGQNNYFPKICFCKFDYRRTLIPH